MSDSKTKQEMINYINYDEVMAKPHPGDLVWEFKRWSRIYRENANRYTKCLSMTRDMQTLHSCYSPLITVLREFEKIMLRADDKLRELEKQLGLKRPSSTPLTARNSEELNHGK